MALPIVFFNDLFTTYQKGWAVYQQHAFKIALLYKNTTGKKRPMWEIRSGQDGKTEMKNGKPPVWDPDEEKWIAIEPSNQSFYYNNKGRHYGAAAYPKSVPDAKKQWVPMTSVDILSTLALLKKHGLVVPIYQIADTLRSLFQLSEPIMDIYKKIEYGLQNGIPDLGFPGKIKIFHSAIQVLGHPATDRFIQKQPYFPMSYRKVPIEKGALLILDLENGRLKQGSIKYTTMDFDTDHVVEVSGAMARIIDAPQVKGALWLPVKKKHIPSSILERAKNILTDERNYAL